MKTCLLLALLCLTAAPLSAVEPITPENPAHGELRAVRDGLLAAMNKGDIEAQLTYLHPNVVVTWHNAQVSRGREGVRQYLEKTMRGPSKIVEKYNAVLSVDELSVLYNDTALAFGSAQENFILTNHQSFSLHGRWTATLVKEGGKWLVTSAHVSDNLFDNPLLARLKTYLVWVGSGALLIGGLVGFLLGRRRRA